MIPRDYQVYEILEEIEKLTSKSNKIEILGTKFKDHTPLLRILKMNFCDTVQSIFPEGEPPFKKEEDDGPGKSSLWVYLKHFPYFVKCGIAQKLPPLKREQILIEMLESVDLKEAEMFCVAKDKALETQYPSITLEVVQKAFPGLIIKKGSAK